MSTRDTSVSAAPKVESESGREHLSHRDDHGSGDAVLMGSAGSWVGSILDLQGLVGNRATASLVTTGALQPVGTNSPTEYGIVQRQSRRRRVDPNLALQRIEHGENRIILLVDSYLPAAVEDNVFYAAEGQLERSDFPRAFLAQESVRATILDRLDRGFRYLARERRLGALLHFRDFLFRQNGPDTPLAQLNALLQQAVRDIRGDEYWQLLEQRGEVQVSDEDKAARGTAMLFFEGQYDDFCRRNLQPILDTQIAASTAGDSASDREKFQAWSRLLGNWIVTMRESIQEGRATMPHNLQEAPESPQIRGLALSVAYLEATRVYEVLSSNPIWLEQAQDRSWWVTVVDRLWEIRRAYLERGAEALPNLPDLSGPRAESSGTPDPLLQPALNAVPDSRHYGRVRSAGD